MAYVDFNDPSIPLGRRKVAYVKWLMSSKRLSLNEARIAAHRKFGPNEEKAHHQRQIRQDDSDRARFTAAQRRWGHT
jgi:hypothetical protein